MMIHMKLIVMATTMTTTMMMMVVAPTKGPRSVIDLDKPDQLGPACFHSRYTSEPGIIVIISMMIMIVIVHMGPIKMLQLILEKKHVTLLSAWCCCVADLVLNLAL